MLKIYFPYDLDWEAVVFYEVTEARVNGLKGTI